MLKTNYLFYNKAINIYYFMISKNPWNSKLGKTKQDTKTLSDIPKLEASMLFSLQHWTN